MANQPMARTIEPGITMFTAAEIRVVVVPIGNVPKEQMDEYLDKINKYRHVPLETAQSFYRETGKSPFQHMPWATGCMHFRFLTEEDAKRKTRMVELHAQRQVLAVIGLGLGPATPDVRAAHEEYQRVCRQFPEALAHRCLVLEASEEQEAAAGQGWQDFFLLPPGDHLLETHLETCMLDMSMSILTEVEKWLLNASPSMMKLNTYIDSAEFTGQLAVLDDLQKLRMQVTDDDMKEKKKWGRLQKAKGDMCLLGGSPRDAANNYRSAMDLAKTTSDYVWYAAAVEGLAHSRIMEALAVSSVFTGGEDGQQGGRASPDMSPMQRSDALIRKISAAGFGDRVMWRVLKEAGVEEEVREMMLEARAWYRKRQGGMPLQVEQQLKLVRLMAGLKGLAARREATEMATFIMEQLAALHLPEDRLIAVGEAAQVLGMVGAARKRSLLLWHASDLCRGAEKLEHHALRIAIKALEPPDDPLQQDPDDQPKVHWTLRREVAVCRSWQAVHTAALATALAAARQAFAHTESWEVAALLLREHNAALDPADQQSLLNVMAQAAGCIGAKAKVRPGQGPGPFVQLKRVLPPPPPLQPIPMALDAPGDIVGAAPNGPFIFKAPAAKTRQNSLPVETAVPDWVCGDEAKVELYLANPLVEPLPLERLWLHVHVIPSGPLPAPPPSPAPGAPPPQPPAVCQCLPVQVTLPPNGKVARVTLSVIPQVPGQLQILGCKMVVWGVQWSQPFTTFVRKATTGILRQPRPAEPALVTVLPPLPVLQATVQGPDVNITQPPASELPPAAAPPEHRTSPPLHPSPISASTSSPTPGARPTPPRSGPIHVYEGQTLDWTLTLSNLSNCPIAALAVVTGAPKGNPFRPLPGGLPPPGLQGAHLQAPDIPPDALPLQPRTSLSLPLRLTVGRAPAGSYDDIIVETRISYMSTPPEAPPAPPIDPDSPTTHTPKAPPEPVGRRLTIPIQLAINPSLQPVGLRCVAQHAPLPDGQRVQHPASAGVSSGASSDRPQATGGGGLDDAPLRCSSFATLEPYCGLHLGVRNCSDRYFRTWVAPLHASASERASTVHVVEPSTEATLHWPLLPLSHPAAASSVPSTPAAPHTPPSAHHSRGPSLLPTHLTRCADHIAATWGLRWQLITANSGPASTPPEGLLRLATIDIHEGITPLAATTVRPAPIRLTCAALPSPSGAPPLTLHNLSKAVRTLQPSCGMGDQLWGLRATCGEAVTLELRGRSETERGARIRASMGVSTVEGEGVVEGQEGVAAVFNGACNSFQYELEPRGAFTHRVSVVMLRPGLHRLHVRDVRVKFDAEEAAEVFDPRSRRQPEPQGASFAQDPLYIFCT